jgi:hypothetical protein
MSSESIIRDGLTYHGISVESRGVFTNNENDRTYAGQIKDSYACGLGVVTRSNGYKVYAEHGPDGQLHGRYLRRWADGDTSYSLWERGKEKAFTLLFADGRCKYYGEACAPDDPRLLALIEQVAPVEVCPASPAPHPPSARHSDPTQSSDGSAGSFCPRRRWRLPWPPRCIPTPHAVAGRCATQPNHQIALQSTTMQ